MHTRSSALLLACTLFMFSAHSFKGVQPPQESDGQPAVHPQRHIIDLNLETLTEEQQCIFLHVLATGELIDNESDRVTINAAPENFQHMIQHLLQASREVRLELAQRLPDLEMAVSAIRETVASNRCTEHAFFAASGQTSSFFQELFTKCAEVHGPFTANNEDQYQIWFSNTLRPWLIEQYRQKNIITGSIRQARSGNVPMDSGAHMPDDEAIAGTPHNVPMDSGAHIPDDEAIAGTPHTEAVDDEEEDTPPGYIPFSLVFNEVDPEGKAQEHLDAWLNPDVASRALLPVIAEILQTLPEEGAASFRTFTAKASFDVFQLMMAVAYGPHYLAYKDTNILPRNLRAELEAAASDTEAAASDTEAAASDTEADTDTP